MDFFLNFNSNHYYGVWAKLSDRVSVDSLKTHRLQLKLEAIHLLLDFFCNDHKHHRRTYKHHRNGYKDHRNGYKDHRRAYKDHRNGYKDHRNGYKDHRNGYKDHRRTYKHHRNGYKDHRRGCNIYLCYGKRYRYDCGKYRKFSLDGSSPTVIRNCQCANLIFQIDAKGSKFSFSAQKTFGLLSAL